MAAAVNSSLDLLAVDSHHTGQREPDGWRNEKVHQGTKEWKPLRNLRDGSEQVDLDSCIQENITSH